MAGKASLNRKQLDELAHEAVKARKQAYAVYSNFLVGAALLATDGTVFIGCNVENASYGLSNCGERTALFNAVAHGHRDFVTMVVCTKSGHDTSCGVCRQALNEFAPNMPVHFCDERGEIKYSTTVADMLPHAFGPKNVLIPSKL